MGWPEIIGAVAAIIAAVLGLWLKKSRTKKEKEDEEMDKAIADRDADTVARIFSERFDRVRNKNRNSAGR